jgi:hypothetical protein
MQKRCKFSAGVWERREAHFGIHAAVVERILTPPAGVKSFACGAKVPTNWVSP